MKETLRRMQKKRAAGDSGFTLVELLVVVVIIGVLVAIAVPMYLNYRKGAANKSAQSDVRAAVSAAEQFYTDNGNVYPIDAESASAGANLVLALTGGTGEKQTATVSPGNVLAFINIAATATVGASYRICGMNNDGKAVYVYESAAAGSVRKATTQTMAGCKTGG